MLLWKNDRRMTQSTVFPHSSNIKKVIHFTFDKHMVGIEITIIYVYAVQL